MFLWPHSNKNLSYNIASSFNIIFTHRKPSNAFVRTKELCLTSISLLNWKLSNSKLPFEQIVARLQRMECNSRNNSIIRTIEVFFFDIVRLSLGTNEVYELLTDRRGGFVWKKITIALQMPLFGLCHYHSHNWTEPLCFESVWERSISNWPFSLKQT